MLWSHNWWRFWSWNLVYMYINKLGLRSYNYIHPKSSHICVIHLVLKRCCFEAILPKKGLGSLGVKRGCFIVFIHNHVTCVQRLFKIHYRFTHSLKFVIQVTIFIKPSWKNKSFSLWFLKHPYSLHINDFQNIIQPTAVTWQLQNLSMIRGPLTLSSNKTSSTRLKMYQLLYSNKHPQET